jgi:hypothetical protein
MIFAAGFFCAHASPPIASPIPNAVAAPSKPRRRAP